MTDTAAKKAKKSAYDRTYRKKNRARIKANKAAYFQRTYDPVAAAKERKKKIPAHVEYCRQDWYRKYKREYDRQRRSKKFGPFAEAHALLIELQREICKQIPDRFERYAQAKRHGWNPLNHEKRRQKRAERKLITDSL